MQFSRCRGPESSRVARSLDFLLCPSLAVILEHLHAKVDYGFVRPYLVLFYRNVGIYSLVLLKNNCLL